MTCYHCNAAELSENDGVADLDGDSSPDGIRVPVVW